MTFSERSRYGLGPGTLSGHLNAPQRAEGIVRSCCEKGEKDTRSCYEETDRSKAVPSAPFTAMWRTGVVED